MVMSAGSNGSCKNIIVIGASAGGVEALSELLSALPADLDAAIFVVVHTSPVGRGLLPQVLQRHSALPVEHGVDGERIKFGQVYVARPDHHLVIEGNRVRVTKGPRENHTRPAIDPLFRSAALEYGPRVVGVVLTGMLYDGSAGLHAVQLCGGTCIVQDPDDALHADMPRNAIRRVNPHHVVGRHELPALLTRLASEPTMDSKPREIPERVSVETRIALGENAMRAGVMGLGPASPYTCPECHGVLLQLKEEGFVRFRCHTGHAYSFESLLETGVTAIEDALWNSVRSIEERVMLLRHIASHAREIGDVDSATSLETQASAVNKRAEQVRQLAIEAR
jgi:two-component system, chemotaxis family, protein-glutamate methylesterase/glutaminase